ncbi:hypothetical protein C8J56DRAFT_1053972 [Mycena floridula]|nr:hypothetical protein C8J56DRAFT_1053972 [Mycena floridula]
MSTAHIPFPSLPNSLLEGLSDLDGIFGNPTFVGVDDYCVMCGRPFSSVALSATSTTSSWDPAPKFDVTRIDSGVLNVVQLRETQRPAPVKPKHAVQR